MKRLLLAVTICLLSVNMAYGKARALQKPDESYDFKGVKNIVVLPITGKNVNFGEVDKDRLPKIKSILKNTQEKLRKHMVVGLENAESSVPFDYKAPNKKTTTLLIQYNIEQFDNGNMAVRHFSPVGGSAKVTLNAKFLDGKTKKVVAEFTSQGKAKGGVVAGGFDAEVLWQATNVANASIFKQLKKLTGLKYSYIKGATKSAKMGFETQGSMLKEEKAEIDSAKKKK